MCNLDLLYGFFIQHIIVDFKNKMCNLGTRNVVKDRKHKPKSFHLNPSKA